MEGTYTNELLQLELETLTWSTVKTTGKVPSPRSRAAVCLRGNKMFLHGGWDGRTLADFYELDLGKYNDYRKANPTDTFVWKEIPINQGPHLAQHSLVAWNENMFIFVSLIEDYSKCCRVETTETNQPILFMEFLCK